MAIVISLFDYSGNAVRDWAAAGYTCLCYDIQHDGLRREDFPGGGSIEFLHGDLDHDGSGWQAVSAEIDRRGQPVAMLFGWPPCDDLAVSGAKHFARKLAADPDVQRKAARRGTRVAELGEALGCPWLVENPIGRMSTLWRKPDWIWSPHEFGGYLPEGDVHPVYPKYIAPRDAYTKKTGAWTGNGVIRPDPRPVEPEILERVARSGRTIRGSRQFMLLGGTSHKTKTIRDETPRGFARAFFLANRTE